MFRDAPFIQLKKEGKTEEESTNQDLNAEKMNYKHLFQNKNKQCLNKTKQSDKIRQTLNKQKLLHHIANGPILSYHL